MENELLRNVKDDHARGLTFPDSEDHFKNWEIFAKFYKHMPCDFWDAHINAVSEAYLSARIAEVAKGECFTEDEVHDYCEMYAMGELHQTEITPDLNAKAAAFVAANVDKLVNVAYEANNHARRLVNNFSSHLGVERTQRESIRVESRADFLSKTYADNAGTKIVQSVAVAKTEELTRWKESAMKVLGAIDLQELAKELGIGLGEDIASQVLPKVKELKGKAAGQWRRYSEEKPDKNEMYLTYTKYGVLDTSFYNVIDGEFLGLRRYEITHWAEIIEP